MNSSHLVLPELTKSSQFKESGEFFCNFYFLCHVCRFSEGNKLRFCSLLSLRNPSPSLPNIQYLKNFNIFCVAPCLWESGAVIGLGERVNNGPCYSILAGSRSSPKAVLLTVISHFEERKKKVSRVYNQLPLV